MASRFRLIDRTHSEQDRRYKALHVPNINRPFLFASCRSKNKRKLLSENSIINREYLYFQKSWLNCHFLLLTRLRFDLPKSLPFSIVEQQQQQQRQRRRRR